MRVSAAMRIPGVGPALVPHTWDAPCARVLSNGSLCSLVTAAGGGFVSAGGQRITSFTPDPVESSDGVHFYLRDEDDGRVWSAGRMPIAGAADRSAVAAGPGSVRIERSEHGIEASLEIAVAPDADTELRRLRLRNDSGRVRRISVTTHMELVLHYAGAHAAHPAFSKLFVSTRRDGDLLLAHRRPRGEGEHSPHFAHVLAGPGALEVETDRARFLGRGRSLAAPAALAPGVALSGTVGNVLDPIASQRRTVELAPDASAEWIAVIAVAPDEAAARNLALRATDAARFDAALDAAGRAARARLAEHGLTEGQGAYLEALLAAMLFGAPSLRADEVLLRRARTGRRSLELRSPPDRPLVVVEDDAALAAEAATFAAYATSLGFPLSVLALPKADADPRLVDSARALARLVLREDWPSLATALPADGPARFRPSDPYGGPAIASSEPLRFANGFGGFAEDGKEYVIDLPGASGAFPPMPWVNVIANERFGILATERGAAHTWSRNCREHRLTPWSNDPIADPHGEALCIRDEDAGGLLVAATRADAGRCAVRGAARLRLDALAACEPRTRAGGHRRSSRRDAPVKLDARADQQSRRLRAHAVARLLRAARARRDRRGRCARDRRRRGCKRRARSARATAWPASSATAWRSRRSPAMRRTRASPRPPIARASSASPDRPRDRAALAHDRVLDGRQRRAARRLLRASRCPSRSRRARPSRASSCSARRPATPTSTRSSRASAIRRTSQRPRDAVRAHLATTCSAASRSRRRRPRST